MLKILEGAIGSSAYGYDGPDSDTDLMSVHVNSLEYYFAPKNYLESEDVYASFQKIEGNDVTSYEFLKFIGMCQKANPNALPLLFLESYTVLSPLGEQLVDRRHLFLSDQTVPKCKLMARAMFHELEKKLLSTTKYSDEKIRKAAVQALRPQYSAFQFALMQTMKPKDFGCVMGKKLRFSSEPFNFEQFRDYFEMVGKMTDDYYLSSPLKNKKLDSQALVDFCKKLLTSALKSELQLYMN